MNDVQLVIQAVERLIKECGRDDMSEAEKAGLFAGLRILCKDLEMFVEERLHNDGYAHEKLGQLEWHVGAALGFDITNGHPKTQHISWAYGSLNTFRSVVSRSSDGSLE